MTAFSMLAAPAQNSVCFWALVLCFAAIANAILLLRQRRPGLLSLSAAGFLVSYFALHLCRALTEQRLHGTALPRLQSFIALPWLFWVLALLLLSLGNLLLYRSCRRWRKSHIGPASIKESLDGLSAGVCYYLGEGRTILFNHRMNDICAMLLGCPLQNGALLAEAALAKPIHELPDGTAVSFRSRTLRYEGQPLHELIADDITELYAGTLRLRENNARASALKAEMRAYGARIDDTVRRQEILRAKADIHDQLNRMLLATQRALRSGADEGERREILRLWRNRTSLLGSGKSAERPGGNLVADLNALAAVIGIELVWDGTPEGDPQTLSLFLRAAREAMTNAAKHGRAAHLFLTLHSTEDRLEARFTNDGLPPGGELRESGGLGMLRQSLEAAGGSMEIRTEEGFCLLVTIPKGGKTHALSGADRGRSGDAPAAV